MVPVASLPASKGCRLANRKPHLEDFVAERILSDQFFDKKHDALLEAIAGEVTADSASMGGGTPGGDDELGDLGGEEGEEDLGAEGEEPAEEPKSRQGKRKHFSQPPDLEMVILLLGQKAKFITLKKLTQEKERDQEKDTTLLLGASPKLEEQIKICSQG